MFESIAEKCCNYQNFTCIGGMFSIDRLTGAINHWIDPKFSDKRCRVLKGLECEFFSRCVIPGLKDKDAKLLSEYNFLSRLNSSSKAPDQKKVFRIKCNRCLIYFESLSRNKIYCPACTSSIRRDKRHTAKERQRKTRKLYVKPPRR